MNKQLLLIPAVAALAALLPLPYMFYLVVKIIIFGFAAYIAYKEFKHKLELVLIFGALAVIFNPVIPINFGTRNVWMVLDLIAAAAFFWYYKKKWF
jgi:hypothetical protein